MFTNRRMNLVRYVRELEEDQTKISPHKPNRNRQHITSKTGDMEIIFDGYFRYVKCNHIYGSMEGFMPLTIQDVYTYDFNKIVIEADQAKITITDNNVADIKLLVPNGDENQGYAHNFPRYHLTEITDIPRIIKFERQDWNMTAAEQLGALYIHELEIYDIEPTYMMY